MHTKNLPGVRLHRKAMSEAVEQAPPHTVHTLVPLYLCLPSPMPVETSTLWSPTPLAASFLVNHTLTHAVWRLYEL